MRALLEDNKAGIRDRLGAILNGQNYVADAAADGEKTLDRIFDQPCDSIIPDICCHEIYEKKGFRWPVFSNTLLRRSPMQGKDETE